MPGETTVHMPPDNAPMEVMRITCLGELTKRDVRVPSSWRTARIYDGLVAEGLAEPVPNVGPLQSGYTITKKGREHFAASQIKPIWSPEP